MRVLFLFLSFPDLSKSSSLYGDLALEFAKRGDDVTVVAPAINNADTRLQKIGDIQMLWVKTMQLLNVNPIKKGIANLLLPYQFEKAIKKELTGGYDLVVISTPPITFAGLASKLKKQWNAKVYLILRDIFPQNAKDLGMISNPFLFSFFRSKEKALYSIADKIGCMSQGNIDFVKQHNPEVLADKLHLLPNWSVITEIGTEKNQMIRKKYNLTNKFVALFGGNIGRPQRHENLLELAKRCLIYKDVCFLFVGGGTEFSRLKKQVEEMGLTNVIIKERIPREDFEQLTAACDLGLISLDQRFTIPNIPSKTLSYLNVGIPILASVDVNTDYGTLLQDEMKAGLWAPAGKHAKLFAQFEVLYRNPQLCLELGLNGRKYLEDFLTVDKSYDTIIELVN